MLARSAAKSTAWRSVRRQAFSTAAASDPNSRIQVYLSRSTDPLVNLSAEHHLLQTTSPDSTILMLYANAPCVVFGRNQNPWLEVNLPRLAELARSPETAVQLIRRRSGGGTVFHDAGNVNFSVICPPDAFHRDKHAEMVVRALGALGRRNVRVNARHDIVMDVDAASAGNAPGSDTFKISGSAYKLTRLRSLHHGTCLLQSPNLGTISGVLRSPAEGLIKARGVDSVRSPVRNVGVDVQAFKDAVVAEFGKMYGKFDLVEEITDEGALKVDKVRAGYRELQSRDWIYGQTPRFAFCTHETEEDPRQRSGIPFPVSFYEMAFTISICTDRMQNHIHFDSKQGIIEKFRIGTTAATTNEVASLAGTSLYDVPDWTVHLRNHAVALDNVQDVGSWMNYVLGTAFTNLPVPQREL